jgi:hypothetical protein
MWDAFEKSETRKSFLPGALVLLSKIAWAFSFIYLQQDVLFKDPSSSGGAIECPNPPQGKNLRFIEN